MLAREFYEDIYWPHCKEILREVTLVSYEGCWRNYIEPAIGDMELNSITPRYLDTWLKDKGITASTWRVFKAFIRTAYKYEEIDRDPCDRCLNAPPRTKPNPPTLTYTEMQRLMDGLKGTYIYTTICCSCYCGLRREEACGLKWEDFEWHVEEGGLSYVQIERGAQYVKGREIFVDPKTRLSRRKLPLSQELVDRIYPYHKKSGRLLGDRHVHQAADYYRQVTKARGLPYVPMSNLRTSWATYMINSGAPVSLVSRYMGHADVETTVRWYTKPSERELDSFVELYINKSSDPILVEPKTYPKISEQDDAQEIETMPVLVEEFEEDAVPWKNTKEASHPMSDVIEEAPSKTTGRGIFKKVLEVIMK